MHLSRFLYTGTILLFTTSCSSMYDVWQGYDDIEPETPEEQIFKAPSMERSELDIVVAQAAIDNNIVKSAEIPEKDILSANLAEIYRRAELEAELSSLPYDGIPALPPVSVEQTIAPVFVEQTTEEPVKAEAEIETVIEDASAAVVSDAVIVNEDISVTEVDNEFKPLVSGDDYSYSTNEEYSETIVIGGEASQQETTDISTSDNIITNDDTIVIGGGETSSDTIITNDSVIGTNIVAGEIKYNKGSDRLSTNDVKKLRAIVAKYKQNPSNVLVVGYALNKDNNLSVDKALALMDLATRRAEKVAANLVKHGIDKNHISVSAEPIDATDGNQPVKKDVTEILFSY